MKKDSVSRDTKRKLLHQAGILTKEEADPKPRANICPCGYSNTHEAIRCVKCNFALGYKGWKVAKEEEERSAKELAHNMEQEIRSKIECEFASKLAEIQNNFNKQQEEEINRRNIDQERFARVEKAIEIVANGNMTTNTTNNATSENIAMTDENTTGNISALNTKKFQASLDS